jgi:hypothetical protein
MLDAVILFNLIGDEWKKGGTMMIRKRLTKELEDFIAKKLKIFYEFTKNFLIQ